MTKTLHTGSRGLKHHLPNRTRLKVSKRFRDEKTLSGVHRALRKIDSVKEVEINDKTGSILVHHAEDPHILSKIEQAVSEASTDVFKDIIKDETAGDDVSILAELIGKGVSKANYGVSRYTGNKVDLKMLLPLIFFGIGVNRASQTEGWYNHAPAYIFFFWAYDAYIRFHLHRFEERSENGHLSLN